MSRIVNPLLGSMLMGAREHAQAYRNLFESPSAAAQTAQGRGHPATSQYFRCRRKKKK